MTSKKNIVITGANTGIGLETAKGLYADGHNIIFGSRNEQKNAKAAKEIADQSPKSSGSVKWLKLDLAKRSSIEEFAGRVKGDFDRIDILINNAGLVMMERQISELGVEMTMAINHFGPFLLTHILFPLLLKSSEARIINLASSAHNNTNANPSEDLAADSSFSSFAIYAKSKLANVQFTVGLAERIAKYPHIKTFSVHPGFVDSDFLASSDCCSLMKCVKMFCCCCFVDSRQGATASLYLSRQNIANLKSGEYYDDDTSIGKMNPLGRNKEQVENLWRVSENLFSIQFRP